MCLSICCWLGSIFLRVLWATNILLTLLRNPFLLVIKIITLKKGCLKEIPRLFCSISSL